MVGLPFDCLSNPLGAVRVTFDKAIASGIDPSTLNGKDWGAVEAIRNSLYDQQSISQVPILDHTSIGWIKPNTLVRFRGMVQDMLGNEFYVGAFKDGTTWRTNKFTDVASFPMGSQPETNIWERQLLYCVPVPGQNSWTVQPSSASEFGRCDNWTSQHGEKRLRENDVADFMVHQEVQGSTSSSKKMREGPFDGQPSPLPEQINETSAKVSMLPDFDSKCLPCLVKIYDTPEADLKLNDVIEFVGVFTFNPELNVQADDSADIADELFEDALAHLPPNKVPRLHCFIHRKLKNEDFLLGSPIVEKTPNLVRGIRESLLSHLTTILGNDDLAAECLLLHLLSRVHARVDSTAVGKLSLNLSGFTRENLTIFGTQLTNTIETLLPFTKSMPLSVDHLNTAALAPKKDYEMNKLISGALQLAEGTHLTIDETQLQAGMLDSTGVENTKLLNNLMLSQKVEYDFKFYKMEMPTDVQLLVLSEGKSNILPADLVLPFQPSCSLGGVGLSSTETLQSWRWYLATFRSLQHDIQPDMQKVMEDDLVAARQQDRSLGTNDFSRWLTIARLMSASFGETCLKLEYWQMAKELERRRKERLNK
ncbi:hypothetical protein ACHQM5_008880 [Ranunculus cassubicifolius]